MLWFFTLGGVLISLCGVFWLARSHAPAQSLPPSERRAILGVGVGWIVMGAGVVLVAQSEGRGVASGLGFTLILGAVCMRMYLNVAQRRDE
ncbi:MAG TPA: hypothetical protein VFY49_06330 [Myxococcota bacterium]|nr:hypothetical protein [Myxococcota bacterium]